MLQAIYEFVSSPNSPQSTHVNMTPRKKRYLIFSIICIYIIFKSNLIKSIRPGSNKQQPPTSTNVKSGTILEDIKYLSAEDQLIQLKNELRVKESLINALSTKIARMEDDIRSNPRPKEGKHIVKRQHPVSSKSFVISDKAPNVLTPKFS